MRISDWSSDVCSSDLTPLRAALQRLPESRRPRWIPDLDPAQGFDDTGFARDGSGWRAFRYKPFPGTFWPTNGASDDVLIRLPAIFRDRKSTRLNSSH